MSTNPKTANKPIHKTPTIKNSIVNANPEFKFSFNQVSTLFAIYSKLIKTNTILFFYTIIILNQINKFYSINKSVTTLQSKNHLSLFALNPNFVQFPNFPQSKNPSSLLFSKSQFCSIPQFCSIQKSLPLYSIKKSVLTSVL